MIHIGRRNLFFLFRIVVSQTLCRFCDTNLFGGFILFHLGYDKHLKKTFKKTYFSTGKLQTTNQKYILTKGDVRVDFQATAGRANVQSVEVVEETGGLLVAIKRHFDAFWETYAKIDSNMFGLTI